jgi:hypothetical protein
MQDATDAMLHTVLPKTFLPNAVIKFMVKLDCEFFHCGCRRSRIWGGGSGTKIILELSYLYGLHGQVTYVSVRSVSNF